MSIGKVHIVLALALVAASCKAPAASNLPPGDNGQSGNNGQSGDNGQTENRAWVVSTLAGSRTGGHADGAGNSAQFTEPKGVAVDTSDNVYVADYSNHRIRKVTAEGEVSTLAGTEARGFADTGPNTSAQFRYPTGVAVDTSGNVYVADKLNHRIRKVVTAEDGTVTVSTLAGSGTGGFADTAPNTPAQFNSPPEWQWTHPATSMWEIETITASGKSLQREK